TELPGLDRARAAGPGGQIYCRTAGGPGPGGPAKAWGTDIQSAAGSPLVTSPVSATLRLWVTTRQKSRAVPSTVDTGPPSSEEPMVQVHDSPAGDVRSTSMRPGGTSRPRTR